MGSDNTFGDTNFNPKMSSEPLEEKPTTIQDCEAIARTFYNGYPGPYLNQQCMIAGFATGYKIADEKANEKISYLESELKALMDTLHAKDKENNDLKQIVSAYSDVVHMKDAAILAKDKEFEALREERLWISVTDRLPNENHDYLVIKNSYKPQIATWQRCTFQWVLLDGSIFEPTHWKPIP